MRELFWSLRSALFVLWLAASVVPWAIISLIGSIFIRGTPLYWLTTFWLRFAIYGARFICGVRWRIVGAEHLREAEQAGAVILLPKHQSTWETFAFPLLMPRPLCYVFKRELLMIPFFGWAMGRLDMIHIDRSRRAEAWARVAEQGRRFMAQGNWIIMFPEGTRTTRGSQGAYKIGGTRLAVTTGTPVLPIAVTSARCWPRKSFMLRPGLIDISIGPLMPSEGRDPDALMREVEEWIETEMRRLDAAAYAADLRPAA
jgi:1-acyl-sn-glycerol-3-phosphate acyltransferase